MSNQKTSFSINFSDALLTTAMIDEMARADNWKSLDDCLAANPEVLEAFSRYADAALRVLKRFEQSGISVPKLH